MATPNNNAEEVQLLQRLLATEWQENERLRETVDMLDEKLNEAAKRFSESEQDRRDLLSRIHKHGEWCGYRADLEKLRGELPATT